MSGDSGSIHCKRSYLAPCSTSIFRKKQHFHSLGNILMGGVAGFSLAFSLASTAGCKERTGTDVLGGPSMYTSSGNDEKGDMTLLPVYTSIY